MAFYHLAARGTRERKRDTLIIFPPDKQTRSTHEMLVMTDLSKRTRSTEAGSAVAAAAAAAAAAAKPGACASEQAAAEAAACASLPPTSRALRP